jgi:hypothetical protein
MEFEKNKIHLKIEIGIGIEIKKTLNSWTLAQSKIKRRIEEQKNKNSKIKKGVKD